ncbi:MAG: deoxyribose-phosphate aldolase [Fimbriimonadaceae bacterium]|jgi:deoxyribose-phosphate aldolase|nr:deoxyribose-phosphate aldolase [Fimbriimonadaceae bacterium]
MIANLPATNPGVPFDQAWLDQAPQSASFDRDREVGELSPEDLALIASVLDLTSLNSDDTEEKILGLMQDAVEPLQGASAKVAGACVYPAFLHLGGTWLRDRGVKLVTVAGAFPHGLAPLDSRLAEIDLCARMADEVDVATPRYLALEARWEELYFEVQQMVHAAKNTPVKVILGTGEQPDQQMIYRAATVAMMAGASFVKTSTGKERVNATLEAGAILCRAIRDYSKRTEFRVGLKPAGGIRTAQEAARWIELVRDRLGEAWLTPATFRIGASALLEHLRYAHEGLAG